MSLDHHCFRHAVLMKYRPAFRSVRLSFFSKCVHVFILPEQSTVGKGRIGREENGLMCFDVKGERTSGEETEVPIT